MSDSTTQQQQGSSTQQSSTQFYAWMQRYIHECTQHEFLVLHQRIDALEHQVEDLQEELAARDGMDTLEVYVKERDQLFKKRTMNAK